MKTRSKIFKEKELLVLKYIGDFSIEQYHALVIETIKKPEWKFVKKILSDLREITFFEKNIEIIDRLKEIREEANIQISLNVYLVNSPIATVMAHLYKERIQMHNYTYCTTINKALALLNLYEYKKEIENFLR